MIFKITTFHMENINFADELKTDSLLYNTPQK